MSIPDCRREHDAILRVAAHLNVQAARLEHDGRADVAARTLRTLDDLLGRHITEETSFYPRLLHGDCPEDAAFARGALEELEGLKTAWRQYVDFWSEDRIARQPRDFGQITQAMLSDVIQRVQMENEELYPRLV